MQEKLNSVTVEGLFNRFNHTIHFADDHDLVILTAPNGHGKTILLRILDSLFNRRLQFFWKLSFNEITVRLQSKKLITIFRDEAQLFDDEHSDRSFQVRFKTTGFGFDDQVHTLIPALDSGALRYIDRNLPVERLGSDAWYDHTLEKRLTTDEIFELYLERIPDRMVKPFQIPEWLQEALRSISTHLVETQRLLLIGEDHPSSRGYRSRGITASSVVDQDASDLAAKISQVLQEYANESQKLDQSFPKRIIETHSTNIDNDEVIKQRLVALGMKRDQLVSAGLIGASVSEPISTDEKILDPKTREILSIYIEDTEKKLSVFDELYAKIRLFKQILDEHFSFKSVLIDPALGITAIDNDTNTKIPLSELSSGEQHELVLIYELLFKVEEGSLILIDEPELSLHVSWQKRFISDLQKIQHLRQLDVVIATHSPQIINDSWDLVQELSA